MIQSIRTITIGWVILLCGCNAVHRMQDELALRHQLKTAYRSASAPPPGEVGRHFERGWKQAYYDVSHGSPGIPPAVPPTVYWSAKYQTSAGQRHIDAWYTGYRQGANVALTQCRQVWANVPSRSVGRPGVPCRAVPELRSEVGVEHFDVHPAEPHEAVFPDPAAETAFDPSVTNRLHQQGALTRLPTLDSEPGVGPHGEDHATFLQVSFDQTVDPTDQPELARSAELSLFAPLATVPARLPSLRTALPDFHAVPMLRLKSLDLKSSSVHAEAQR